MKQPPVGSRKASFGLSAAEGNMNTRLGVSVLRVQAISNRTNSVHTDSQEALIGLLKLPSAYPNEVSGPIVVNETHISWVLLAGDFAYKIKKQITTDFLDYGSLEKRHNACCEEVRLGRRYADWLYLDVVPITGDNQTVRMNGCGQPIEYAVRMKRFEDGSLLSQRIASKLVTPEDMVQLAKTVAIFHQLAMKIEKADGSIVSLFLEQAKENFTRLKAEPLLERDSTLQFLEEWTLAHYRLHQELFRYRSSSGSIRECHGDLHCDNVVFWNGHYYPFDGIEFNAQLSWIDTISDISFLAMDLKERGRPDLANCFLNAYFEQTGDYEALPLLRWYMVYRALVRAKVGLIRAVQIGGGTPLVPQQLATVLDYLRLAHEITRHSPRRLWITHGLCGSGKTTGSQLLLQAQAAIRIRSDIERKRMFAMSVNSRASATVKQGIYSDSSSQATYDRLYTLAKGILRAGYSVVVDATFLRQADRMRFRQLALDESAVFSILDFQVDEAVLRERIDYRQSVGIDASDANQAVLDYQLSHQEPLTAEERLMTIDLKTESAG